VNPPKLLWGLSHDLSSGSLLVQLRGQRLSPAVVELYRGWVHAVDVFPVEPALFPRGNRVSLRGEDALRLLLRRDDADWRFDALKPALKRGSCAPFHPAAVIRNVVPVDLPRMRALAPETLLQLSQAPHPSCIGIDERALVAFLGRPHTIAELIAARPCPFERAQALLSFLEQMGTLSITAALSSNDAYALLELPGGASRARSSAPIGGSPASSIPTPTRAPTPTSAASSSAASPPWSPPIDGCRRWCKVPRP
jgi:hypothetical protein